MQYRFAPEVKQIATELIHDPENARHAHLRDVHLIYLFREEAQETKGRLNWGKARKLTGKEALYARRQFAGYEDARMRGFIDEADAFCFEIQISYDVWKRLPDKLRRWLVNHELKHCALTDKGALTTVPHDLEVFFDDAEEFGVSAGDVRKIFRELGTAGQLVLEVADEGETVSKDRLHGANGTGNGAGGVTSMTISGVGPLASGKSVTLTGDVLGKLDDMAAHLRSKARACAGVDAEEEDEEDEDGGDGESTVADFPAPAPAALGDDSDWDTGQPRNVAALAEAHRSEHDRSDEALAASLVQSARQVGASNA